MRSPGPFKPQVKPEPCRYAGWRGVGITSHMIIEVGKILGMPVYVLHNEQKLYEFIPEGYKEQGTTESGKRNKWREQAIVYNVWGSHAFMYAPGNKAARNASKLRIHARAAIPKVRLQTRSDDNLPRVRFDDMRPLVPQSS